jgi:hypothetical protein
MSQHCDGAPKTFLPSLWGGTQDELLFCDVNTFNIRIPYVNKNSLQSPKYLQIIEEKDTKTRLKCHKTMHFLQLQ